MEEEIVSNDSPPPLTAGDYAIGIAILVIVAGFLYFTVLRPECLLVYDGKALALKRGKLTERMRAELEAAARFHQCGRMKIKLWRAGTSWRIVVRGSGCDGMDQVVRNVISAN